MSSRWLAAGFALALAIACLGAPAPGAAAGGKAGKGATAKKASSKPAGEAKKAKTAYKKGVKLYKQGSWEEAIDAFQASFEASPDPKASFYIGMCLAKLERWLEAEEELEELVEHAGQGIDAKKREEALEALDEVRSHIAVVTVVCDVEGATLAVDGEPSQGWEVSLVEGAHELTVSAEGHDPVVRQLDLAGGEPVTVEIAMDAFEDDIDEHVGKGGGRGEVPVVWFATTAGLAGALAAAAVITGSLALSRQSTYDSMGIDDDWQPYRETTLKLGLATDVLWGMAGAAAVAAVVLAVFTDFGRTEDGQALSVDPVIGAGWLGLEGEF